MGEKQPHPQPQHVPVQADPLNAETPMATLRERITPPGAFFVRNHFPVPAIDGEAWRLRIDGVVEREFELSRDDLARLPRRVITVTMECAGNGRSSLSPPVPGVPWNLGAVGTADFTGAALRDVLVRAGVRPEAKEIVFEGADRGEVSGGRVEPYLRSLPVALAMQPDILLAYEMNGRPLAPDHGFPVRLVVPGWYGMASVKWLTRIAAVSDPLEAEYQSRSYLYQQEAGTPDGTPVATMRVRSLIVSPQDGDRLPTGEIEVVGRAWSGSAPIARVELSTDGGASWQACKLDPLGSAYAGVLWHCHWRPPKAGTYTLVSRATDTTGDTQPLTSVWNAHGFGNNAVQRVRIQVGRTEPRP